MKYYSDTVKSNIPFIHYEFYHKFCGKNISSSNSVRDPKLIITDPDPQIKNQEFRIRIRIPDPDPSVTRDGEKKLTILVIMKTKMG